MKLEEGRNRTEMLAVENTTLKEKLVTLEDDAKRLRKQSK
jgi:predicted nuclease with TOPRIM domain